METHKPALHSHPVDLVQEAVTFQPARIDRAMSWTLIWTSFKHRTEWKWWLLQYGLTSSHAEWLAPIFMDSVSVAIVWLLSVLERVEYHVLIMHFSLITGCYFCFSWHVFIFKWSKSAFPSSFQLWVAAFISPLICRFPVLELSCFLRVEGGKVHFFPLLPLLKQYCKEIYKGFPQLKSCICFRKKNIFCYIQLIFTVLQPHLPEDILA